MTTEEIIAKLDQWSKVMVMPANEWLDFGLITEKIEELTGISIHGNKQMRAFETLKRLIWFASKEYNHNAE